MSWTGYVSFVDTCYDTLLYSVSQPPLLSPQRIGKGEKYSDNTDSCPVEECPSTVSEIWVCLKTLDFSPGGTSTAVPPIGKSNARVHSFHGYLPTCPYSPCWGWP